MDYGKVPLHKRTRLQHTLFYESYNRENKRAKTGGAGDFSGSNSGDRREKGPVFEVSGGGGRRDSESVAASRGNSAEKRGQSVPEVVVTGVKVIGNEKGSGVSVGSDSVAVSSGVVIGEKRFKGKKGVGFEGNVNSCKSQSSGEGLKKAKRGGTISVLGKKISDSEKSVKSKANAGSAGSALKRKGGSKKQERIAKFLAAAAASDDDDEESDDGIEYLGKKEFSNGNSSRTELNSASRSELWREKRKDFNEVDDAVLCCPKIRKCCEVENSKQRISGASDKAQSKFGASKKSNCGPVNSEGSEASESSSKQDNGNPEDEEICKCDEVEKVIGNEKGSVVNVGSDSVAVSSGVVIGEKRFEGKKGVEFEGNVDSCDTQSSREGLKKAKRGGKIGVLGRKIPDSEKSVKSKANAGSFDSGLKRKGRSKKQVCVTKFHAAAASDDDDEDDEESDVGVEYLGKIEFSNQNNLRTGSKLASRSEVERDKRKDCDFNEVDDVVFGSPKIRKRREVENSKEKITGASDNSQSSFCALKKSSDIVDCGSINSEGSDASESSSKQDNDNPEDEEICKRGEVVNDKGKLQLRASKKWNDVCDSVSVANSEDSEESESSSEEDKDDSGDEDYQVQNDSSDDSSSSGEDEDEVEYKDDEIDEKEENNGSEPDFGVTEVVHGKGEVKANKVGGKKDTNGLISSSSIDVDDGDDKGNNSEGSVDSEAKGRSNVGGLERRRFCGLDLLIDLNSNSDKHRTMAQRLRSSSFSKSRKKKQKLGTVSCPFIVDDELSSSLGDDEEYEDDDDGSNGSDEDNDDIGGKNKGCMQKVGSKGRETLDQRINGKLDNGKKWKLHKRKKGDSDFLKIIADSIWEDGNGLLEKFPFEKETPIQEKLPLIFRFPVYEDPLPPEKPAWQEELDALFAEMQMSLRFCEIGATIPSVVDNDDAITPESINSFATPCSQGVHHLILDEQIGIVCKYCNFVQLEIKDVYPELHKNPWGCLSKDKKCKAACSTDELQAQFSECDSANDTESCLPSEGAVWAVLPGIKETLFSHQQEGFEFMWKKLAGDIHVEKLKGPLSSVGSGCIISHAPGTGKTRMTIAFLQSFLKLYPYIRPLIIAPCCVLQTWEDEFLKWKVGIPFHNLNNQTLSGKEKELVVRLLQKYGYGGQGDFRVAKLYSWKQGGSVLAMSYSLFGQLAGGCEGKQKADATIRKILLECPGLLVLDEGHIPRNQRSRIWRALSKMETRRRIILSGTLFQNNFDELFNTLQLANPKFAGRISCRKFGGKRRGRKSTEAKEKWVCLTNSIGRSDDKVKELRAMIGPFCHVHEGTVLRGLPGLRKSVVVLNPTDLQQNILKCIEEFKCSIAGMNCEFSRSYLASLSSVHPSLLIESGGFENKRFAAYRSELKKIKSDPCAGVKTKFLLELLKLSETLNERVLIFSEYIAPLTFIKKHLELSFGWIEGREVLYMDGKLDEKQRQLSINSLNDPESEVKVLLASMRACSEGINLVGASRVVLLDVVWNPSVQRQAIARAYRIGQTKVVHVYHLIISEMECKRCIRQAKKDRLSKLIFSSVEGDGQWPKIPSTVSEDKILEAMVQHEKLSHMFLKILNQPTVSDLIENFGSVD